MTAVRGHSLLRRFRPDRPDVLVLFMALLLKQFWTGRTSGRRGTWNGRRAPAACLPWRRPAGTDLRSRHVHAAAAISVSRRAKTTQWRTWPDTPGSTAS